MFFFANTYRCRMFGKLDLILLWINYKRNFIYAAQILIPSNQALPANSALLLLHVAKHVPTPLGVCIETLKYGQCFKL